jgi:hypothetical protein
MLHFFSLSNALRSGIVLCLSLLSMAWLSSCSDDDDDASADDSKPLVSFTNLTDNGSVWNTVKAEFNVTDDNGIEKLEIYIDGTLFKTITAAPFEVEWNTTTATEGVHTIKIVATDKSGNTAESQIAVTVKNILLSFDVANDQLGDEIGLIILSDETGKVIASTEYQNGDHIELKSSTFNGEKFSVTEGLIYSDYYPIRLWTYTQVERGEWNPYNQLPELTTIGTADLNCTNAVTGELDYEFSGNAGYEYGVINPDQTSFSADVALTKTPSKLYVRRMNSDPSVANTYHLFPSITTGANAIDLSLVNQALTSTTVNVPQNTDELEVILTGYPVTGNYAEPFDLGSFDSEGSELKIEHPGNAFPSYYSETFYATNDFEFISGRTSALYNTTAPVYNVTLSGTTDKLNYSASGNYDFLTATYYFETEVPVTAWGFIFPQGTTQSVAIPDLAEAVSNILAPYFEGGFNFSQYVPDFTDSPGLLSVHEYETIQGYDGLKSLMRTSNLNTLADVPNNFTTLNIKLGENQGGRVATQGKGKTAKRKSTW